MVSYWLCKTFEVCVSPIPLSENTSGFNPYKLTNNCILCKVAPYLGRIPRRPLLTTFGPYLLVQSILGQGVSLPETLIIHCWPRKRKWFHYQTIEMRGPSYFDSRLSYRQCGQGIISRFTRIVYKSDIFTRIKQSNFVDFTFSFV